MWQGYYERSERAKNPKRSGVESLAEKELLISFRTESGFDSGAGVIT